MTEIQRVHEAAMANAFRDKRGGPDCAYCRSSEWDGKRGFACKLALPMKAATCTEWRDSRTPSSFAPNFVRGQS